MDTIKNEEIQIVDNKSKKPRGRSKSKKEEKSEENIQTSTEEKNQISEEKSEEKPIGKKGRKKKSNENLNIETEEVVEQKEEVAEQKEEVVEQKEEVAEQKEEVTEQKEKKKKKVSIKKDEKIEKNENNYIKNLINENINEDILQKKEEKINNELESKLNDIINNLKKNTINEYTINQVKQTFDTIKSEALFIQIINNKMYYLEKKSNNNKNSHILNIIHKIVNQNLINNCSFIIDTSNENKINENYVLRFNKIKNNQNSLLINYNFDYNFDYIKSEVWVNKENKIYVNKNFISNELWENIKLNNSEFYELEENINYEKLSNYKYVLYEENEETVNYELDILRLNNLILKVNENKLTNKLEKFYSDYINEEDYETINLENYENMNEILEYKNKLNEIESINKVLKLKNKIEEVFTYDNIENYIKNLFSRLSLKCETSQIIKNKIFSSTLNSNYLENRIHHEDNKFEFSFQGKDFEIMLNDKNNKINILVNEFSSNIFFNNNNIFNYRILDIVSNNNYNTYSFLIRNRMLYLYKNKIKLVYVCRLPEIFNIDKLSIRNFNKDSWWIC